MRKMLTALALVALIASGCAKKTSVSTPGGSTGSTAPVALSGQVNDHGVKDLTGSGTTLSFTMSQHDFYFDPTFLKTMPDAKVTVTVNNAGSYKHNFTIKSLNVDEDVAPGKSVTVTFTLPASGAVAFFCEYHKSSGMQGAFFFHAGDTVGGAPASSPTGTSTGYGTGY